MDKNSDINIMVNFMQKRIDTLVEQLSKSEEYNKGLEEALDTRQRVYDRLLVDYIKLKKKE